MRTMYDAAFPPPDPRLDVCAFYIGGDTPHVWGDEEIQRQSARWRLPIYVCDNPGSRNPVSDASQAINWMIAHKVPKGTPVALDFETAVNGDYVRSFDDAVVHAGWKVLLYGSLSTVEGNPRPSAGFWTASWTKIPHLDATANATQYASDVQLGKPYDLSLVSDSLVLWDTGAPSAPPPPPVVFPTYLYDVQEDELQQIESLARNPEGQYAWGVGALGSQGSVTFSWDGGYNGVTDTAHLRVVVWDKNGFHISDEILANSGGRNQVMFPDPGSTYLVTATRLDTASSPIGVAIP